MSCWSRVLLPLIGLVLVEVLLRVGVWDPLLEPQSFAGMARRKLDEIDSYRAPIDFVTLGNSRAEYGLDHTLLARSAGHYGYTHANASLKGAHWLTIVEQSRWLHKHRPEIRNALIGMGAMDLMWADNGNYEISLVEPMATAILPSPDRRSRFDVGNVSTYGAWSSLFAYRTDIRWFVSEPGFRLGAALQASRSPGVDMFESIQVSYDSCSVPMDTLEACASYSPRIEGELRIVEQCRSMRADPLSRQSWVAYTTGPLPKARQALLELRRAQIRELGWSKPVIVLMPMGKLWNNGALPQGYIDWALRILQPLAEAGEITLIDATEFFERGQKLRCDAFWDTYHLNTRGAHELTTAILPDVAAALYRTPLSVR